MTLKIEITHHYPLRGEPVHTHMHVEAVAEGYLSIDGVSVDMRGAAGGFYIQEGDGFGGWSFERDEGGSHHLHLQNIIAPTTPDVQAAADDELPSATEVTITTYPAYPVWPSGAPEVTQTITGAHSRQLTVATVIKMNTDAWMERLKRAADQWTETNNSIQWARNLSTDPFDEVSADAKARVKNFNLHARMLGLGRRVVQKYGDPSYGSYDLPSTLTTAPLIEVFITKIQQLFNRHVDWYRFFVNHNLVDTRLNHTAKITGFTDHDGALTEPIHVAASNADFNDLMGEFDKLRAGI